MAVDSAEPRAIAGGGEQSGASLLRFRAPRYWPAWLLVGWLRGASLLPWRFAVGLHKGLGSALCILLPRRRRIVERSIELAFPSLSRTEIQVLARRHFENLGACLAETAFAWFGQVDESLTSFEIEGDEHVYSALASGRGVILHTGHFTPIEICGPVLKASHGVFAPANPDRSRVVPRTGGVVSNEGQGGEPSDTDRQRSLTWAQRLERVFAIERILAHLDGASESADPAHPSRAPPQGDLLI